ncbi:MAG: hypothetical protein ABR551_11495 [Gemmatimonadales bacterium]
MMPPFPLGPLFALVLALCGCEGPPRSLLSDAPWVPGDTSLVRQSGRFADNRLSESSGVAVSRAHPGVLWTHNDAGHPAVLFATDTLGRAIGRYTVTGARSVDWEDIALGPCPSGECLYIGDVGDNEEQRPAVMIYRVPEPDPSARRGATLPADTLRIRYPDRPRDVEALFVDQEGGTWLVSKGRSTGIILYHVPAAAWETGNAIARLVDTLPIRHHLPSGRLVSGAAVASDGRRVVIRTYRDLFLFTLEGGRLEAAPPPNRCEILGLEPQGEAVDWWDDSTLVLTSESRRGPVHLLRCGQG